MTMREILTRIKMFGFLRKHQIYIGSERSKDKKGRRVTIKRKGKRSYGSKTYTNIPDLQRAWLRALEYEYNKLNRL